MQYRYTKEKKKEKGKIREKIRECLIKEETPCSRFDRPINCAEAVAEYPSGAKRCPAYKEADIDELNVFYAKDLDRYSIAWNRDKRKYIIYRNNRIMLQYDMQFLDYAMTDYWELQKNLA